MQEIKWQMNIKIFHIATRIIYLVVFNEFLCQDKLVIEKHIKFIIETDIHIKFIEQ